MTLAAISTAPPQNLGVFPFDFPSRCSSLLWMKRAVTQSVIQDFLTWISPESCYQVKLT